MADNSKGVAASLYSKLEADRSSYITDGVDCAELTIREVSVHVSENQIESHHKRTLPLCTWTQRRPPLSVETP